MDRLKKQSSWQEPSAFPLILMLSGKAGKLLGVKTGTLDKAENFEKLDHWSSCWRCEFLIGHEGSGTHFFLCSNARTLFSFVIPNGDGELTTLVAALGNLLFREFQREEVDIPPKLDLGFILVRGQPRSLIGSQNELVFLASDKICEAEMSMESLNSYLNEVPLFAIEDVIPNVAFKKLLVEDPPFLSPAAAGEGMGPGSLN